VVDLKGAGPRRLSEGGCNAPQPIHAGVTSSEVLADLFVRITRINLSPR
jgi:hypothetical protein